MEFFITLIGMVMVVEGFFYALFPSFMKKAMVFILSMKDDSISNFGKVLMVTGAVIAWLINT